MADECEVAETTGSERTNTECPLVQVPMGEIMLMKTRKARTKLVQIFEAIDISWRDDSAGLLFDNPYTTLLVDDIVYQRKVGRANILE